MIFSRDTYPAPAPKPRWCLVHAFLALLLCLIVGSACRTPEALLPTDIAQAGSTTYEGQAVWSSRTGARGVAGELLVIIGGDGSCFIQFSKPPFNLVTARCANQRWIVEPQHGPENAGAGAPPAAVLWFQLARVAVGNPPEGDWRLTLGSVKSWVLENSKTGERLEGYLTR